MLENEPRAIGETRESVLEDVIFADPATHALRAEWEEARRTEMAVFDRVCAEEYARRLEYHQICQTPEPEGEARREVSLCKPLWMEELDEGLGVIWARILARVSKVLEEKREEG